MSIAKIQQLRKERKNKVTEIKSALDKIANDEKYSGEYKMQQSAQLNREMQRINQEYDIEITNLLQQTKNETERNFYNAEFDGMNEGEATKALLREMRAKEEAEVLARSYKDGDKRNALYSMAEGLVNVNSPQALAYIKAMKTLGVTGAESLENQYKEQNYNEKQKLYKSELEKLQVEEQWYEVEKTEVESPMKAALLERAYFGENE